MTELTYTLKCLAFTVVLTIAMQFKIGGESIESRTYTWLRKSDTSQYIQSVAAGGVLALKNLGIKVKEGIAGTSQRVSDELSERASR